MAITGSLHVLLVDRERDIYGVTFVPYQSGGRTKESREIQGRGELKIHLLGLRIHEHIIERALLDVQLDGKCDIANVSLDGW